VLDTNSAVHLAKALGIFLHKYDSAVKGIKKADEDPMNRIPKFIITEGWMDGDS
jgi:hypothetical protein